LNVDAFNELGNDAQTPKKARKQYLMVLFTTLIFKTFIYMVKRMQNDSLAQHIAQDVQQQSFI